MILFGASGHAKVIADILLNQGVKVDFIVDDNPKLNDIFAIPVKQNNNQISNEKCVISIGNNAIRKKISENYDFEYQTAIHSKATISEFSKIGEGTVIMANAVINPDATIGKHCIINTSAVVEHDCKINDFVHISPNVSLAGNVEIGEGTHIGIGSDKI